MKTFLLSLLSCALIGCTLPSHTNKLNKLEVGMPKAEALKIMGKPTSRSATEGVEYYLYWMSNNPASYNFAHTSTYFLRFKDGKLDAFGERGDFDSTKDPTTNINIRKVK